MTQKLKTQLFNTTSSLFILLFIVLMGLFIFATFVDPSFFLFLIFSLVACLFYLLPLRNRIIKKQAEVFLQIQSCQEQSNLLEAQIKNEEKAIQSFQDKIVSFSKLKGVTERLSMCLYMEDTTKSLADETNKLFGSENTTVILYIFHSKTGELGISSSQKGQIKVNLKAKKGDVFDQWVVKTMQPLLIEDAKSDYRFDVEQASLQDVREIGSLISVPLIVGNKALGILRVDSPQEKKFTTEDLRFLTTIGDLGAVATENAQLYECTEQLAIKDGLTGLYLRRHLLERMPEEINRQFRHKKELAFLILDLDKFKRYNDSFGHVAGDIVLRTIGKILLEFFNEPGNLVCRYGGEEFCVVLPDCTQDKAVVLAEEIREKIAEKTILLRREKTRMTVSIGISIFPKDAQNVKDLIHNADVALYKAKENGRNRVEIYKGSK